MDNVTGRDDWIIQQALMWAIAAIDRRSPDWRPYADRADMETLLLAWYGHDRAALDRDVRQFTRATAWPLILRHDDDGQTPIVRQFEFPEAGGAGTNKSGVAYPADCRRGQHEPVADTDRYDDRIAGTLSCYDRLVITGTLPVVCYAAGMTGYLNAKGIRIFDYPEFAKALRDRVRDRAVTLAAKAGVTIEHIAKPHVRKEDIVARVLRQRGDHPGLVHIISAMEACDAYKPWHDKQTHRTFIRPDSGKRLHDYFYVQDAKFGLVYLRAPTWAPFRLQFYCNGHSWLARKLTATGIGYTMADNAFVRIDDWALAQALADTLSPDQLHRTLDRYAKLYCPVSDVFGQSYHWSLMQVEYATDLVFRSAARSVRSMSNWSASRC